MVGLPDLKALYDSAPVRDALAAERTLLAAERTFLAYVRTSFAMFVAGVSGATLIDDPLIRITGYALAALSAVVFVTGWMRLRASLRESTRLLDRLAREV